MEHHDSLRYAKFVLSILSKWKHLTEEDMKFERMKGMTNKVYKVTLDHKGKEPKEVILRQFCGVEGVVDQDKEAKVFKAMSESGLGPRCLGEDNDLRLEEFFDARDIKASEYKEKFMRRRLAQVLAGTHKIKVPDIDQTPLFGVVLDNPEFYKSFIEKCDQDIYNEKEKELIKELRPLADQSEQDFIRKVLPNEELVFSHNDLLTGNILVSEDKKDVRFIDYEYASYNFRGFDIGNMFRESLFDYTYKSPPYFKVVEENFPNEQELRDFIRYYLIFTDMSEKEKDKREKLIEEDSEMEKYIEENYNKDEFKEREDSLYKNVRIGAMLAFYYWTIWGVKMFKEASADFDYLEYARANHEKYQTYKAEIQGRNAGP